MAMRSTETSRYSERHSHPVFRAVWYAGNALLILSVLLAAYSVVWEYSTRKYLKGFSDAIVPESASPSAQEKVEAILNWMAHGPARRPPGTEVSASNRDPVDTLNYAALLQVCGTATNAFINLAASTGLRARRLLLLDSHEMTKHVVAEVQINGRWIVVDPLFRVTLHGPDGRLLARKDLADPAVFSEAMREIPNYDPTYNYERTAHVHLARIPYIGRWIGLTLDKPLPDWADSPWLSLLLERESLAVLVLALALVAFAVLLRVGLRRYGEVRLGIHVPRVRRHALQACITFFNLPN